MKACRVSNIIATTCASCGARSHQIHRPIFKRGRYCHVCCPVCTKTAEQRPEELVAAASTAPKLMAPGSQWLDLGYGPPRDRHGVNLDPWYFDSPEDKAERCVGRRIDDSWIPRRPHWFRRRR